MLPKKLTSKNENSSQFSLLGTASTMGLHMVSGPIVGGVLGWLIDRWLDTWPWGAGIGILLGVAAGFRNVWADAKFLIRNQDEPRNPDQPPPAPKPDTKPDRERDTATRADHDSD